MVDYIKRIEEATDRSVLPLIGVLLNSSLIAESWNNHYINRGAASIDLEYHQNLRKVAIEKLISLGVGKDNLQLWFDMFLNRVNTFGFFKEQICSQILDGTIPNESLSRLFARDPKIFNRELDRIADVYSENECAYARQSGCDSFLEIHEIYQMNSDFSVVSKTLFFNK